MRGQAHARHGDVIGWLLSDDDRERLLTLIPPLYPHLVAHHVTLKVGAGPDESAPRIGEAQVIGEADDGDGVQALIVRINATTDRPGGGTYHITWSLAEERKPVESNDIIASLGWTGLDPIPITLTPARF